MQQPVMPPTPPVQGAPKKKKHVGLILVVAIVVAFAAGVALGSNISSVNKSTAMQQEARESEPQKVINHVGATVTLGDQAVTLLQVVDPATASNAYQTPEAGKRLVGIELQIQNAGQKTVDQNANNNLAIIGSDNQTYNAVFAPIAEGTNFDSGAYTLSPSKSATGWVTIALPLGVNVAEVQFKPNSGFYGGMAEWIVP